MRQNDQTVMSFPAALRQRLERGFLADLTAVTIHTGPGPDRLARALGADAFTYGSSIYFRDGTYRPDTARGLRLLAHEAAHVVQQAAGVPLHRCAEECERDAELAADVILAGGTWDTRRGGDPATGVRLIQRHVSFEHRLFGDVAPSSLSVVSSRRNPQVREQILDEQLRLLALWKTGPEKVDEGAVRRVIQTTRTLRVGPDKVLVTYGELNALPDYLADAATIDTVSGDILLPILQVIRQEGYNQISLLRHGHDPKETFERAACAPWGNEYADAILSALAIDALTQGLGPDGQDHYQALLARNACHFAPFSWYRWQASYIIARDYALKAHQEGNEEYARRARVYGGYADHFLEDSFAAGHLINKTVVMQWFIEWATPQRLLPLADWDIIKNLTTREQPGLDGAFLYDPASAGPSVDPQTVQEWATLAERITASKVQNADRRGRYLSYQDYLIFISSSAAQFAVGQVHDHYNNESLWVTSKAQPIPYQTWGDHTLLTGVNGFRSVEEAGNAVWTAKQSLAELIDTGETAIKTSQIRDRIPTGAGPDEHSVASLKEWMSSQRRACEDNFGKFYQRIYRSMIRFSTPRMGVVSRDQEFTSVWSSGLTALLFMTAENLTWQDRLFSGSDGIVFELDPRSGKVRHQLSLAQKGGLTHLATDGSMLFAGTSGSVFAIALNDWSTPAWSRKVGEGAVNVLFAAGKLYAGSDGRVTELDPVHSRPPIRSLSLPSSGTVRLATDGTYLFAGVCGDAHAVLIDGDWSQPPAWSRHLDQDLVNLLPAGGRLYAGSNGSVFELSSSSGEILNQKRLSNPGSGAEVKIALSDTYLFAGTHGYAYGLFRANWSANDWYRKVGGSLSYGSVSVATSEGRFFVGSNGYALELDPHTGDERNSCLLTYGVWAPGTYDTSLTFQGGEGYAGVHGFAYKLIAQRLGVPPGTLLHSWQDQRGWHWFEREFDGAPPGVATVFGLDRANASTQVFSTNSENALYHNYLDSGGWHGWTRQPNAPKTASVFAVGDVTGNTEVFAIRADDGMLFHSYITGSNNWQEWTEGPQQAGKVLSVFGVRGGSKQTTEVFAIGLSRNLYRNYLGREGWHNWTENFASAPAGKMRSVFAVATPVLTHAFALDMEGTFYYNCQTLNGEWSTWSKGYENAPGGLTSVYGLVSITGSTEVFAIDGDGVVHHFSFTGTGIPGKWTPNFGDKKMRVITGARFSDNGRATLIFGIAPDDTLYQNALARQGNWQGWASGFVPGGPAKTGSVSSLLGATGNTELFVISG